VGYSSGCSRCSETPTPPTTSLPPQTTANTHNEHAQWYGYFGGLHRYGTMATTVLDTSNTFLHAAKSIHATGLPEHEGISGLMFKLFALVFFIVRVALPPFTMLYPGIKYGRVLPAVTYCITNGLMFIVYALQLMW